MDLKLLEDKVNDLKAQRESAYERYEEYSAKEKGNVINKILAFINEQLLPPLTITSKIGKDHIYENFKGKYFLGHFDVIKLSAKNMECRVYTSVIGDKVISETFLNHCFTLEELQAFYLDLVGVIKPRIDEIIERYIDDYSIKTLRLEEIVRGGK